MILLRHGESEANARHLFQGAGSSPLTPEGRSQAERVGARLAGRRFAIVESSDLERAVDTARLAGFEPDRRSLWREGDIGEWEGLDEATVLDLHAEELESLQWDYDLRMGVTGESVRQMAVRAHEALEDLVARLDDGEAALVVTHGGLIGTVLGSLLDVPAGRRRLGLLDNTALCEITFDTYGPAVRRYNDAVHLGPVGHWAAHMRGEGAVVFDLIRHGVTYANLERRVQGQRDDGLHPRGRSQARRLRDRIGEVDAVYSSSSGRARATAEIVFERTPVAVDDLMEINLGEWEGRLWDELEAAGELGGYPSDGTDIPRGRTGETWADVQHRVGGFLDSLSRVHAGDRVAVTSHGGSIRAYAGAVLGFGYGKAFLIGPPENTSVTQVVIAADGHPVLATYNITAHLEG